MRPSADGAVQSGKQEQRCPRVDLELVRTVVHEPRGRSRTVAAGWRNNYLQALRYSRAVVKSGPTVPLVTHPECIARCVGQPPGILQKRIHVLGFAGLV